MIVDAQDTLGPGFRLSIFTSAFSQHFLPVLTVRLLRVFSDRAAGGDRVRIEASDMCTMTTIKALDRQLGGSKIARKRWRAVETNPSSSDLFVGVWDDVIRMEWHAIGGKDD